MIFPIYGVEFTQEKWFPDKITVSDKRGVVALWNICASLKFVCIDRTCVWCGHIDSSDYVCFF